MQAGTTRVSAARGARLPLAEVWRAREVLYLLAWRDTKVRYRQTVFGALWAVLQPAVLTLVFSIFLGRLVQVPTEGIPYALFAFAGLVPWTFFANSLASSSMSVVSNARLVSRVFFPRLVLPLASVVPSMLDLVVAVVVLFGAMVAYGVGFSARILWLPAFLLLGLVAALGVGTLLAALNVRYRDIQYAVPFAIQVWMFLSPVAYPSSLVPEDWLWLYRLNPMVAVVDGFRWACLGTPAPVAAEIVSAIVVTAAVVVTGLVVFSRAEEEFADVI